MLGSRTDHYYCFMWNKLFRRRLIQDIWTQDYRFAEDWDFTLRTYFKAKKAVLLENDLYWWLQHPSSMSRKADAMFLLYQCKAQIFYDNLRALPDSCAGYQHFLLRKLYAAMAFWKARSLQRQDRKSVFQTCRRYTRDTFRALLRNLNIPFFRKVTSLVLLCFPRFTHLLLKVSNII